MTRVCFFLVHVHFKLGTVVKTVWFGPGSDGIASVKTWAQSDSFCRAKGLRLATYDQYCPNGMRKVVGGAKGQCLFFTLHNLPRT